MSQISERQFLALVLSEFASRDWTNAGEAALTIAHSAVANGSDEALCDALPRDFLVTNSITCDEVLRALRDLRSNRIVIAGTSERDRTAYPQVEEMIESIAAQLDGCGGLAPRHTEDLADLLRSTFHYLRTRIDGERSRFPFLFAHADRADLPLEGELADDYVQWVERTDPGGRMLTEVRNVGGGRVDVLISYATHRFVVEVKRELTDASPTALRGYLGQTGIYTKTDVGVAVLLVYDLTPKPLGVARLSQSVWLERLDTGECIVVVVVPGNRGSPSGLSRPGARGAMASA